MKKLIYTLTACVLAMNIMAQTPAKISYQAILRDAQQQLASNQSVSMQISILKGNENGSAVYVETHSVTTNDNGLVSIEIGAGSILSGNFSNIEWGSDTYFIKTETDMTGGTNYDISATSQLLSVPYAMHAKTATNIAGGITITESQISDLEHTTDTKLSESEVDAFVQNNGYLTTEVDGSITNEIEMPTDAVAGDMVYYDGTSWSKIDKPSDPTNYEYSFEWDINNGKPVWQQGAYKLPFIIFEGTKLYYHPTDNDQYMTNGNVFATGATSFTDGKENTQKFVVTNGTYDESSNRYAAGLCDALEAYGYDDWFLPAINELAELRAQNKVSNNWYWSSTEKDGDEAYTVAPGPINRVSFKSYPAYVRCVRKD